jgi:HEAT repeat protein
VIRTGCGWVGLLLMLAASSGCQPALPAFQVDPAERLELETRSLDLLIAAAQSDAEDVACNALEALVRVAPQAGAPTFRLAVRSPSPLVRHAALAALGEVRDRQGLALAEAAIRDDSRHVQLAAAFCAARCGKDGFVRLLVDALRTTPAENIRAEAAALLGRLDEPRAKPWLRAALQAPLNRKSKPVTLAIHGALAALGDTAALHELIGYAQGDAATRSIALLLLADLGNPEARDALRYRFLTPLEDYVEARLIAARGLGRLGDRSGYELAMQHLDFKDPNPEPSPESPERTYAVRSMAIHALAEIGDLRAVSALRGIAADQSDPRLQVAASYALQRLLKR